ncbi:Oidioi.mRNA.OKI2018_I69.XSR.g13890.t2.cds [Oikopleura dioica]|uniref:Oidioi.mRNA.OKI2018_I69.XSR.g13890.t2.cds n=1 Tax=Oikopleura dioica TaxID=34765 RepID=A0ABN7SC11_OIKDI|nr:Oidioi.mRNA.OKI2018_I69.XSR.g13890.t2.cds [Oikopleura dioica]
MMQLEKPATESDLANAQVQFDEWLQKQKTSLSEEKSRLQAQKENQNPMKAPKEDSALELTGKTQPLRRSYSKDTEPLIFKMGEENLYRKRLISKDARIAKTGINLPQKGYNPFDTDLTREAAHRRRLPREAPSSSGGDLFAHRPTTAEVKDKQRRAYKAALDAQMASRRRGAIASVRSHKTEMPMANPPTKHESIIHHPSFETLVNNPELNQTPRPTSQLAKQAQKSAAIQTPDIDDYEDVKVPTPRNIRQKSFDRAPPPQFVQQPAPQVHIVHAPPAQQPANPPVQQIYHQPPPPSHSIDDSRLQAALEQATMNLQSTSAALTRTGGIAPANFAQYPTTTVQYSSLPTYQEPENQVNTPRRVQIDHTPRVSQNEPQQYRTRGDGSNPNKQSASDYAKMLREQIQQRQREKQRIKNEENAYNAKKEVEMRYYDPFGRGGAGAPVRGKDGQVMTDLRQMQFINKQLENNVDLTYELKDVEQRNTPAPPSRIEQLDYDREEALGKGARVKSDIFGEPQKKDYNYMAYLEDEIRKKEELKRKKKEQEELEAQKEEQRIMKEIEKLNRQAEEEKRREELAKAQKEQQKMASIQRQAPKLRRSDEVQRRTQFKTTPRQPQREYRSRGRQSTTLSDISWDQRSEMNLYLDQPAPSRQSRHPYHTNHAAINTKALEEIDRMKEALQQELMHVQYKVEQKNLENKYSQDPVYNSSYPKPQFSAPPRHNLSARNRSIMAPPTDEQIRQNTQEYINRTTATDDLTEKDLLDIKNDDQIGDGAKLDDNPDPTFLTAVPTEKSIDIQRSTKVEFAPSPESSQTELDTAGLAERNAAREKLILEVEKSLEAPEDSSDRLQIVSNSHLD